MNAKEIIKNGIINENPTFIQVVGISPVLAVTASAVNGLGMGLATTIVLTGSNFVISLVRSFVPASVRIPIFVVVISTWVTIVEFMLKAFFPVLDAALGIFIPLIAANCIILARAEAYAYKNNAIDSTWDGIGMGIGFTIALIVIGCIREFFGSGSIFGINIMPEAFPRTIIMILPPGAFITIGFLMAGFNMLRGLAEKGGK